MFDDPNDFALRDDGCLMSRKLTAAQSLTLTLGAAARRHEGGGYYFSAAKSNTLPPRGSPHLAKKLSCCACEIASECSPVNFAPFFLRCLSAGEHFFSAVIFNCFSADTNEPDHVPLLESLPMTKFFLLMEN